MCCAVRGGVVVLGGDFAGQVYLRVNDAIVLQNRESYARVEILGRDSSEAEGDVFKILPPLSCGPISSSAVVVIDEIESDQGQVLLIGGWVEYDRASYVEELGFSSAVWKVDLATGVCTAQPPLLCPPGHQIEDCTAGRLPDGRVLCVVTTHLIAEKDPYLHEDPYLHKMAQVLEPPKHGSPVGASWQWRALPGTSEGRVFSCGCVLSDGRFAVFGGLDGRDSSRSSCEALTLSTGYPRWDVLPPMHESRSSCVCAAIGGCVIVTGDEATAEVYEEGLGLWRQLPCSLPHTSEPPASFVNEDHRHLSMGSAVM
jgi:hypothetical protein